MKNLKWLILSAVIIVLDQGTKFLAVTYLQYEQPLVVVPAYFNLTLVHNTGAAFSFLAAMSGWQRWFFVMIAFIVSGMLVRWLMQLPQKSSWLAIALSLVIGGALGNMIDRIRLSYVIDFIQLYYQQYYWPTFNIADSTVVMGAIMIALYYLKSKPHEENGHASL